MIGSLRISQMLLCGGVIVACHTSSPVSEPTLSAIAVTPGRLAISSPAVVADIALTKEGPWRVAVVSPATMTAAASAVIWDLRQAASGAAPLAARIQLPGVSWVALNRDDGSIFTATPISGTETEALPAVTLTLLDDAGAETCHVVVNGTGQMKTAAMAVTSQGLAWVGSFSGALAVGSMHLTSAADTDGVALFLTPSCQVTGAVRLSGPRGEGMSTVNAWPRGAGGDTGAPTDWLVTGRFGELALLGDVPLQAAVAIRRGMEHSLAAARISSTGDVKWASTLSGGAPLFATASAIAPNGKAVVIAGSLRGPVTVRDASSSRPSLPTLPLGGGGKPDVDASVNVSDGFVWQLDGTGVVQHFARSPYLGNSDVSSVAFIGGQWLIAGQLRGSAPGYPAQRFGLFAANVVGDTWKTTQLVATTSPVIGWLAAVEHTSTALLLRYDGATLQWSATPPPSSNAR